MYVTYNGFKSNNSEIRCRVPHGSILGPLLFLLYINDLASVSEACFSILFAYYSNMFISGKDVEVMSENETMTWRISGNGCVVKKIQNTNIERVSVTKFLGLMIDAQLSWKCHIGYTCKKISKCVGVILKARKKLNKSVLLNLYYSFAYPYFIYCNHVWGNSYPTNLK